MTPRLRSIIAVVEAHHGESSQDPPVSTIDVFGAGATEQFATDLRELGFPRLDASSDGFVAHRGSPTESGRLHVAHCGHVA